MVALLFFSILAHAVWLEDIYGNPPKSYFSAHQKLLDWGHERNWISSTEKKRVEECLKNVNAWYLEGTRIPQFELRIGLDPVSNKIQYRWLCRNPKSKEKESPYQEGPWKSHPSAALITAHRVLPNGEYSLEMSAYVDSGLQTELSKEIQKVHTEFGFLADTWHYSRNHGLEVAFP